MAKKKKVKKEEETAPIMNDPYIGADEDDLADMEYIQDETTRTRVETHPPETAAEAELLAEQTAADEKATEEAIAAEKKEAGETEEKTDDVPPEEEEAEAEAEAEVEKEAPEVEVEEAAAEVEEEVEEDIKIPKDRFDEVNDRMKNAEKKVESLEKQLEGVIEKQTEQTEEIIPPYDYDVKEIEAMDALLEGDQDKYKAIRTEIRKAEREETLREARKIAETGDIQSREDLSFEETGAKIEAEFPAFSQTSEAYDETAREEMLDLYVGYARSGKYSRVEALQRSAEQAAKIHGLTKTSEAEPPDNVIELKPTNVKKKVKAATEQPPVMEAKAAGETEATVDVMSMSDEQFDALPESTKKRLRGDIV